MTQPPEPASAHGNPYANCEPEPEPRPVDNRPTEDLTPQGDLL